MTHAKWIWFVLGTALLVSCASSIAQDPATDAGAEPVMFDAGDPIWPERSGVDPEADRLLQAMSAFISETQAFTFTAEVAEDVLLDHGQMVTYGRVTRVAVQRPGSLRARTSGEERTGEITIHDGRCTLFNADSDVYAITEVPSGLGEAVDTIVERYGLNVPLADIVYEDPYDSFGAAIGYGFVAGTSTVAGMKCHHLAFQQELIDWQIWIDAGPQPLLRRLVINYKDEPGSPNYMVTLSDWDLGPRLSPHFFEFVPPPGADRIDFLPVSAEDES